MGDTPKGTHEGASAETHVEFPTEDLPGTAHPNPPATDQQGVKGMEPASKTGTQSDSKAPAGTPGVAPLSDRQ